LDAEVLIERRREHVDILGERKRGHRSFSHKAPRIPL
jgi:hypothetical protein